LLASRGGSPHLGSTDVTCYATAQDRCNELHPCKYGAGERDGAQKAPLSISISYERQNKRVSVVIAHYVRRRVFVCGGTAHRWSTARQGRAVCHRDGGSPGRGESGHAVPRLRQSRCRTGRPRPRITLYTARTAAKSHDLGVLWSLCRVTV
jgi:hypothetical protein